MIGIVGSCGSCKHFKDPKLITGHCEKHNAETAIFGNCKYFEPKIVHENEVMKKMEPDNGH